jgi:hypothetical protein
MTAYGTCIVWTRDDPDDPYHADTVIRNDNWVLLRGVDGAAGQQIVVPRENISAIYVQEWDDD